LKYPADASERPHSRYPGLPADHLVDAQRFRVSPAQPINWVSASVGMK
jgi:hypothetical protein